MSTKVVNVYHLNGLPFELGRYDVPRIGREAEWARLKQLVAATGESRSPVTGVLLGTYGAGKSFLLWKLGKAYEPSGTTGVLPFGPIRLLDPEQKKDFTKSLILRLFARGTDVETQLAPVLAAGSRAAIDCPAGIRPFVNLLLALARPDSSQVARRVLMGGRALRREAERAGIGEATQVRTSDDAIALLQALQLLSKAAGIKSVVLLIDEVEYIDALPTAQRTAVLDSLKHLWDQEVDFFSRGASAAQLLMLLSATPNFWQQMKLKVAAEAGRGQSGVGVTPFFARIRASDIIEMPADLTEAEARQLIASRMKEARPGQKPQDVIPFTNDYVDYVYQLSQGLPRQIIEICGVVMNEAAERNLRSIDATQAKKILRDLLISYEPVGKGVG